MERADLLKREALECERISRLEREQARIDRMIAREEKRRKEIARRLEVEVRRLQTLRVS